MTFLRPDAKQASTLCVLSAKVADTPLIFQALGGSEGAGLIFDCLRLMNSVIQCFGGRVLHPLGDGLLAAFPSADNAAAAAEDMMRRIHREPGQGVGQAALRVGLHQGPVWVRESDICAGQYHAFGETVRVATRMAGLAKAGQIMATQATLQALPARWRQAARLLEALTASGNRACELAWRHPDGSTMMTRLPTSLPKGAFNQATLRYHQLRFVLDDSHSSLSLGREYINDIVFDDRRVSRQHARVERRRDKVVLIDNSTNGTYVTFEGAHEIPLKMEEIVLSGRGTISLGCAHRGGDGAGVLEFEVL